MKHLYLFSGLGVDGRVFKYLNLSDYHVTYIEWTPHDEAETLKDYAKKLVTQIKTTNPILIGLSFGGMVAIEIGKIIETEKIILISSIKARSELPYYFKISAYLRLHQLIPSSLMKQPNSFLYWMFGAHDKEEKELLSLILQDTNPRFLKWAIDKIIKWDNKTAFSNLSHIHGTADRIMPHRFVKSNLPVKDGGHFMTITKANEVSTILRKLLAES